MCTSPLDPSLGSDSYCQPLSQQASLPFVSFLAPWLFEHLIVSTVECEDHERFEVINILCFRLWTSRIIYV